MSKVWSFGSQKFGHLDIQSECHFDFKSLVVRTCKKLCIKRPQHLKYDVALVIIDVPMTTLGRPMVSREES